MITRDITFSLPVLGNSKDRVTGRLSSLFRRGRCSEVRKDVPCRFHCVIANKLPHSYLTSPRKTNDSEYVSTLKQEGLKNGPSSKFTLPYSPPMKKIMYSYKWLKSRLPYFKVLLHTKFISIVK